MEILWGKWEGQDFETNDKKLVLKYLLKETNTKEDYESHALILWIGRQ